MVTAADIASPCEFEISPNSASSSCGGLTSILLFALQLAQLVLGRADLLDLGVRDVERVEDLGLGHLVGAGLDHQDGLFGAGDDQVETALALGQQRLFLGVDDEVAFDAGRCALRRPACRTGCR